MVAITFFTSHFEPSIGTPEWIPKLTRQDASERFDPIAFSPKFTFVVSPFGNIDGEPGHADDRTGLVGDRYAPNAYPSLVVFGRVDAMLEPNGLAAGHPVHRVSHTVTVIWMDPVQEIGRIIPERLD